MRSSPSTSHSGIWPLMTSASCTSAALHRRRGRPDVSLPMAITAELTTAPCGAEVRSAAEPVGGDEVAEIRPHVPHEPAVQDVAPPLPGCDAVTAPLRECPGVVGPE